jgi:hypothetical protein
VAREKLNGIELGSLELCERRAKWQNGNENGINATKDGNCDKWSGDVMCLHNPLRDLVLAPSSHLQAAQITQSVT